MSDNFKSLYKVSSKVTNKLLSLLTKRLAEKYAKVHELVPLNPCRHRQVLFIKYAFSTQLKHVSELHVLHSPEQFLQVMLL